MKRSVILLVLMLGFAAVAHPQGAACDRQCLRGLITQYLNAVVAHNPGVFTENTQPLKLGVGEGVTVSR